jgi:hypothetical protein
MDLKEVVYEGAGWILLAHGGLLRAQKYTFGSSQKAESFF